MSDKKVRNNFLVQAARSMRRIAELENREGFVESISEITPNLGGINAGIQVYGDDITINTSTNPATFTGSGYVVCWPPIEVLSGVYAVAFALNSGTVTYYIRNTDGKLYAGAGAVTLDADGITLASGANTYNQIKWKDGSTTASQIGALFTSNVLSELDISATRPGTEQAIITLTAGRLGLALYDDGSSRFEYFDSSHGGLMIGDLHRGEEVGYAEVVAASTTPTSGYSRTMQDGSMGANGWFAYDVWFLVSNTGGTSVSCSFTISFGGSTLHTVTSPATGTATPRYILVHFQGVVANVASESAQRAEVIYDASANALQDTAALSVSTTRLNGLKTATVDTSSGDRAFDISGTLSTATNSKLERLGVNFYGPYYSA